MVRLGLHRWLDQRRVTLRTAASRSSTAGAGSLYVTARPDLTTSVECSHSLTRSRTPRVGSLALLVVRRPSRWGPPFPHWQPRSIPHAPTAVADRCSCSHHVSLFLCVVNRHNAELLIRTTIAEHAHILDIIRLFMNPVRAERGGRNSAAMAAPYLPAPACSRYC